MKYDSVLDQQSISGKIVSLILCVWKPCYMKSGHICTLVSLDVRCRDWMTNLANRVAMTVAISSNLESVMDLTGATLDLDTTNVAWSFCLRYATAPYVLRLASAKT